MVRTRLCTLVVVTLALAAGSSGGQTRTDAAKVVHVVAERFSFSPSELTIDEGTILELRISSGDTTHGFKILGPSGASDIDVEIPKRGRGDVRVTFEAKEPGTYVFECSRVCGAGHGFMRGTIRVRTPRPRSGS